ncbi:MAG: winged helix-turn-helix transcriptional regulator [Candidatus Aenigmarchaeota archaeon]|nr:winged helix-turn-helix transcriptional regulator [Candidatus Aenigmarchaeota archaeon]
MRVSMMSSRVLAVISLFLAIFSVIPAISSAQELNSYSIDVDLARHDVATVKLVFVLAEPVQEFGILLPFRVSNFSATSTAGPVDCRNQLEGVSIISCSANLTEEKKTLEMTFQSSEMIRPIQGNFVFTGDFSVKIPAKNVFAAVRLPEGMILSQDIPGGSVVPMTNSTSTDGRKITVVWRLTDVVDTPLTFQVFYEPAIEAAPTFVVPPKEVLVLLGIIFGGGIALIAFKSRKKTQEVILSVMDDYEKNVISSIEKAGGKINQKKIATDTNLSKAKISRVVHKLLERGIVEVERRGRTNIVSLSKKKFAS